MNNEMDEARLTDVLRGAFPGDEPSDNLHRRVEKMAMEHDRRSQRGIWGVKPARVAVALTLLLIVGGTLAYRYLMHRPGEQAIQLIPANALMVLTVDLKPSAQQVTLFNRINAAIKNQGLEQKLEEGIKAIGEDSEVVKEVKPYISNSLAFAMLPKTGASVEQAHPVIFLSLNNKGKVEEIVARHGKRAVLNGLTYYKLAAEKGTGAIIEDYLVLSEHPAAFSQVTQVLNGEIPSVAGLREYQWARSALPEDANLMFFLSPTALAEIDKESKAVGMNPFRTTRWFGLSATLRDAGIMFDYRWPYDSGGMPSLNHMAQIPPIDDTIYKKLPAGAYGLMLLSQPSRYWDFIRDAVSTEPGMKDAFTRGVGEFEKETGISVDKDILPGLNGSFWLAAYPDPKTEVGAVIVFDDANGAEPAALAEKVRGYVERITAKDPRNAVKFVPNLRGSATYWQLDANSRKALNEGLQGAVAGANPAEPAAETKAPEVNLVYAQVGKAVLFASSQELLDKAVTIYSGGGLSLADDPAFQAMRANVTPGSQSVVLVNLGMIMEKVAPLLDKQMKDSGVDADDIIRLFGQANNGLVASGKYDGTIQTGNFFLPLEYERVINLMGAAAREIEKSKKPAAESIAL